jgi:ribonucleoside-diphosphate reductase alpha chain
MDRKPFSWVTDVTETFLKRDYLLPGQTTEERVKIIADNFEKHTGVEGHSDKFYDYMSRGWFSLSTPVWTNYGTERGMPVSCFGSYIEDSMCSILYTVAEVGLLSKYGGGTSGYIGDLRPKGAEITDNGKSMGSVHFMELFDKLSDVVSQGSVRRGQFSPYMPLMHDDFYDFMEIGDKESKIHNMKHGVVISDEDMENIIKATEEKNENDETLIRWAIVLKKRKQLGFPYIMFEDNANKHKPEVYKDRKIHASNMCSEIMLPSNKDETFVCVLSSMNLTYYDEWKDTDAVEILTLFLDTVNQEFINKIDALDEYSKFLLKRVRTFAANHRALGLGVVGYHTYLQKNMMPVESREAAKKNLEIFKHIQSKAMKASKDIAVKYKQAELLKGVSDRANTTLIAIAPTKSSSHIIGQRSPGIEPEYSNYYTKDLAKIKFTWKNPILNDVLKKYNKADRETWKSIRDHDGSVQHLDFLSKHEKDVFKTLSEINPTTLIDQACIRQNYICQGQSLNMFIDPNMSPKEVSNAYIDAWRKGLKAFYYQYNLSAAQMLQREKHMANGCTACEG